MANSRMSSSRHVPSSRRSEEPAAEGAGHAGGEDAGSGYELVPALVEALDGRGRRCDALAADRDRLAAIDSPGDRGELASRPVQVRLDDLEHESRRAGGVERVPSPFEHRHSRGRSEPVGRRDHPVGAAQLRPRREHGGTLWNRQAYSSLVQTCAHCGQENPEGANFCNACGAALAEPTRLGEERRIVSVLFVDLVGFTSRAEKLDPEDVRAFLMPYYASVRDQIEQFGGTVEKFIGDAIMGVFGAPITHGDDPERAVRAALAVRDWATEESLQLRIAVNTGEAIVAFGARPGARRGDDRRRRHQHGGTAPDRRARGIRPRGGGDLREHAGSDRVPTRSTRRGEGQGDARALVARAPTSGCDRRAADEPGADGRPRARARRADGDLGAA